MYVVLRAWKPTVSIYSPFGATLRAAGRDITVEPCNTPSCFRKPADDQKLQIGTPRVCEGVCEGVENHLAQASRLPNARAPPLQTAVSTMTIITSDPPSKLYW